MRFSNIKKFNYPYLVYYMKVFSSSSLLVLLSLLSNCVLCLHFNNDPKLENSETQEWVEIFIRCYDGLTVYDALKIYCEKEGQKKLFVRKTIVNWEDLGPYYTSLVPTVVRSHKGKEFYVVEELDFGKIPEFEGTQVDADELVMLMKTSLIKRHMFPTMMNVRINNVIVNGIHYNKVPFELDGYFEEHY
jgi:hypothetical protein